MEKKTRFDETIRTIQDLNTFIVRCFGYEIGIDINAKATMPRTGSHRPQTRRVPRQTNIRVLCGLKDAIRGLNTVAALRSTLTQYVQLRAQMLPPNAFLIFGADNRLLHGNTVWVEHMESAPDVESDIDDEIDLGLPEDEGEISEYAYLSDPDAATADLPDDLPFWPADCFLANIRPELGDYVWVKSPTDGRCYYALAREIDADQVKIEYLGIWENVFEWVFLSDTYLVLMRSLINPQRILTT
jgi:hypothetical protein